MATFPQGFYISLVAPIDGSLEFTTDPFDPGTNVFASISLNQIDTLFEGKFPDSTFTATSYIGWWTFYLPDGTESPQQDGSGFTQNSALLQNVARINFVLFAQRAWAIAQISIFAEQA
ncbi:hypothetical protein [Paraburkholderia atlantica]|uniref:hypothetical protein n=1 Tax=Paraburkholderia atlantica TaxID=2654982 RepID=UPI001618EA25|nr:hypothetical protein [Paraburkholderia atlantica]MBB5508905.1 hypothetical protein [Paraburkholderia atlantica]